MDMFISCYIESEQTRFITVWLLVLSTKLITDSRLALYIYWIVQKEKSLDYNNELSLEPGFSVPSWKICKNISTEYQKSQLPRFYYPGLDTSGGFQFNWNVRNSLINLSSNGLLITFTVLLAILSLLIFNWSNYCLPGLFWVVALPRWNIPVSLFCSGIPCLDLGFRKFGDWSLESWTDELSAKKGRKNYLQALSSIPNLKLGNQVP